MEDNKNFMLAIALTVMILFGYTYFYGQPQQEAARQEQLKTQAEKSREDLPDFNAASEMPDDSPLDIPQTTIPREDIVTDRTAITINSPHLHGSIALMGARIDDLTLSDYKETLGEDSKDVALLSPAGTKKAYFVDFNWVINGAKGPDKDSVWTADSDELNAGSAVTLTWNNGEGLSFERTISLDNDYMFSITQKVTNNTGKVVKVAQYGRVVRNGRPSGQSFYISHEGPIWSMDEGIEEFSYSDLEDQTTEKEKASSTDGGWVGITDKYWLVALIPDQNKDFDVEIYSRGDGNSEKFHTNFKHGWVSLESGASTQETSRLFAGAKKVSLLDQYTELGDVKMLNYAIDWGMFYFLTKPIFYLLEFLYNLVGNFGIAILLLTFIVKLALFPIANKGYKSMNKMKLLQPKMQELKEKLGDDKAKMQQATMELYKKEKVNPVSGCLPMFLQFPVFFALYKVLYITIDMRHAPFFGWIKDLSGPDTMLVSNLFGLIPWEPTGFLALGILPILMGFTMWLQMQMNPSSGDPMQRKIMLFMPIVFTFMLSQFAVGLVVYWTFSNILGILQQWVLMRRAEPVPVKS